MNSSVPKQAQSKKSVRHVQINPLPRNYDNGKLWKAEGAECVVEIQGGIAGKEGKKWMQLCHKLPLR